MNEPTQRNSSLDARARSNQRGAALHSTDLVDELMKAAEGDEIGREEPAGQLNDFRSLLSMKHGETEDFSDPELEQLNDPDVAKLHDAPLIGGRGRPTEIFGEVASTMGRVTSPKLLAQASNFPTATQFRVWRWENGAAAVISPTE